MDKADQKKQSLLMYWYPALRLSIAFVWIWTALCSAFFYPTEASMSLLSSIGVSPYWQPILLYGGSILDGLLGVAMLFNFRIRWVCWLQLLLITVYTLIITFKLPVLWIDPFAPIAKNIPLMISIFVILAWESEH
jgi:hypothetical protein